MVAVLEDDCFATGPERIRADEALRLLRARLNCIVDVETVPLGAACGRILAQDLVAERNIPNADNSAVDGYALRAADLAEGGKIRLPVVMRVAAGDPPPGLLQVGAVARIFTGAPMPEGADCVVMQEDAMADDDHVIIPHGLRAGANRRLAGEDLKKGEVALRAGSVLRPQHIGLAAALGHAQLRVFAPLHIALFSSGDELCEPGGPLAPGGAFDVNRYLLSALLGDRGVIVSDLGILPDNPRKVHSALRVAARQNHVVMTSGGASVGDEDHIVRAVSDLGALHFWSIAVKPGRPLAFGRLGDAVFIGLPGNPVAAMVCFLMFVRPVLRLLGGGSWCEPRGYALRADFDFTKKPGRLEWLRGSVVDSPDGQTVVRRFARQGSGIITGLTASDGLIELRENVTRVAQGELVKFIPFTELGVV